MNYWLTLHGAPKTEVLMSHKNLYMKDKYADKATEVRVGDKVAFYCGKRAEVGGFVDYLGEIAGERSTNIFPGGEFDEIGNPKWKWYWPVRDHQTGHFASRAELLQILGLGGLRIAGGLMPLSRDQFALIASTVRISSNVPVGSTAEEWMEKVRLHRFRERKRRLVILKKSQSLKIHGVLRCEACEMVFSEYYGIEYIECHHTIPVASLVRGQATRVEDLRLLCANCHRAVHLRGMTVEELKVWLQDREIKVGQSLVSEPIASTR